ncbi:hypothetical protein P20495_2814 [Pseudoalteromonas sp. BSi20495]|nr:hypothetical protein P20495_2814 [Pseudoalteromonas sp. BSi20495]
MGAYKISYDNPLQRLNVQKSSLQMSKQKTMFDGLTKYLCNCPIL